MTTTKPDTRGFNPAYLAYIAECHQKWLAAGGDIERARAEAKKQMDAEWYRVEHGCHGWNWNNHPGMGGGAGSPNRPRESLNDSFSTDPTHKD